MKKRKLIILSAPSGTGKNTLIGELLKRRDDIAFSISTTTRPKKKGEKEGRDYYFLSKEEFQEGIKRKIFLEWAEVLGNYYGTSKKEIRRIWKEKKTPILDLDVQGALSLKRRFGDRVVTIFILPPSLEELENRLRKRGRDNEEEIKKRLELAKKELLYREKYDYQVVNDSLEEAIKELSQILDRVLY